MNTFDAMIAAIREVPQDDVRRLALADWLDEFHPRGDLDAATAEFIRLTCGLGHTDHWCHADYPVRPDQWVVGRRVWRGEDQIKVRQRRGGIITTAAAKRWLTANWRRLVPTLTRDWDYPGVMDLYAAWGELDAIEEKVRSIREGGTYGLHETLKQFDRRYAEVANCKKRREMWIGRTLLQARVPIPLPTINGYVRVYTPEVVLKFSRGFVVSFTYTSPALGPKLATWVRQDQPLVAGRDGPADQENL